MSLTFVTHFTVYGRINANAQCGCGFIGMFGLGTHVFFPSFILKVDTATDCHLQYVPVGRVAQLSELDYVQPKSAPQRSVLATAATTQAVPTPALIEPDDGLDDQPSFASHWPKRPSSPPHHPLDMSLLPPSKYTKSLKDMDREELISRLYSLESQQDQPSKPATTAPLECMSSEDIVLSLHHSDKPPPAIRPCDTPNALDTKHHFTAEELHRLTGCRQFRNYRHLVHTTKDGQFLDNGEFPVSIGAYTTIPKAPRGKPLDRAFSKYLDIVHVDIAFGDCMSVGGCKYALIFVDRATCFNWCFGLKSLHHNDILLAFLGLSCIWNVPPSYPARLGASLLMAWSNLTGKSWSICLALTSRRNRCLGPSGTSQLNMPHE